MRNQSLVYAGAYADIMLQPRDRIDCLIVFKKLSGKTVSKKETGGSGGFRTNFLIALNKKL